MNFTDIAKMRLYSQHIAQANFTSAHDVVSWMGAMQAQDYAGALWAIALRTPNLTQSNIEQAIIDREIVRTWPMRGTLHFVASEDIRWMLKLLAPRIIKRFESRRRELGIDDHAIKQTRQVLEDALSGGKSISRPDLFAHLESKGIATSQQRGIHLLGYLSHLGVLCFGPHQGKQPAFVLLDEWLLKTRELSHEESLAEFAKRYFTSHGPATLKDFAGWGTLSITEAKLAITLAADAISKTMIDGAEYWHSSSLPKIDSQPTAFLLPGFDEFMLGYKDRSPALVVEHSQKIVPGGNGMFLATIIVDGQVVGTWKKIVRKNDITIALQPFERLSDTSLTQLEIVARRYGQFLGVSTKLITD